MKLIIADDERLVRESIKSMLAELDLPIVMVGEASNGEELVALAGEYAPDIALVDIRMPKLSGLAGIKAAKAVSPQTQWIILTGFSEFTYAQEAIRLRAINFLLKPVSPDQLREALEAAMKLKQQENQSAYKEFESDVMALLHGLSRLDEEDNQSVFHKARFEAVIFAMDSSLEARNFAEKQLAFCRKMREISAALSAQEIRLALVTLPDGDLGTICAWGYTPHSSGLHIKERYCALIEQLAARSSDDEFAVTVFRSGECATIHDLLAGINNLPEVKPLRTVCGIGRTYRLGEVNQYQRDQNIPALCELFVELGRFYQEGNYYAYIKSIRAIQKNETKMGSALDGAQEQWRKYIYCTTGCRLRKEEGRAAWFTQLEEHGERLLKSRIEKKQSETDLVERVTAYVVQNYQYDIGIGHIAAKMDVTPNYLSMLFHKKTGRAFMKYLTEVRMIKAKERLTDPNLPIQAVAEEVGYYSARHFAKVFTQFFGCYPSEYRKSLMLHSKESIDPLDTIPPDNLV